MGKETLPENHSANWAWAGSRYVRDRFITARLFFSLQSHAATARMEQFQDTRAEDERGAPSSGVPEVYVRDTTAALLERAWRELQTPAHKAQQKALQQPAQRGNLTCSKVMRSGKKK